MSDLPETAMGVMRLMPSKASEVAQFSAQIIKAVQGGEANPLEVLVMLRSLEAVSEMVREEIEDNILNEAEKHSEKKFNAFGAIIERAEVGVKYNYGTSKDTVYERLQVDADTAKRKLDERTAFLRGLKDPMTIVDEMTGEIVTITPPLKKSKSGVKVYLANVK